jgi:hypothetical protein
MAGVDLIKAEIESYANAKALLSGIPLEGIVVLLKDRVVGFSLGVANSLVFRCLFQKADAEFPGAAAYVFSELGRYCRDRFPVINTGDDWNQPGLRLSKMLWRPFQRQALYSIHLRSSLTEGQWIKSAI